MEEIVIIRVTIYTKFLTEPKKPTDEASFYETGLIDSTAILEIIRAYLKSKMSPIMDRNFIAGVHRKEHFEDKMLHRTNWTMF